MGTTYRAFISYSHRNNRVAHRIHKELETWKISKDLIARTTPHGPVPKTLRPICRDREDFAGGGNLPDAIQTALKNSMFLIVLCSPESAASPYVNEEIRFFKSLGKTDHIIPVIIAGEPGAAEQECFPAALTHQLDSAGNLTDQSIEPLAADTREQGDGRRRALAKVVAGLLGLPVDEIIKRSEQAQRRKTRTLISVAATMFVLAIAAAGFAWQSEARRVVAEHNYHAALNAADSLLGNVAEELIRVEGIQLETTKHIINRAAAVLNELSDALPDAQELKISKVSALLVFAKAIEAKGDHAGAIETYRQAQTLLNDIASAAPEDKTNRLLQAMIEWRLGSALAQSGNTQAAYTQLKSAINTFESAPELFINKSSQQTELLSATTLLSLLLSNEGRLDEAALFGEKAIALAKDLLAKNPDNWRFQTLIIPTLLSQAELLARQDNNEAAIKLLMAAESKLLQLINTKPDAPQLRSFLATIQTSLASLHEKSGDKAAAQAAQQRSIETVQQLAEADIENLSMQRQHADNLSVKAQQLAASGAVTKAATLFKQSQLTLQELLNAAPHNALIYSSLTQSLSSAADTLNKHQRYKAAEAAARKLLALRRQDMSHFAVSNLLPDEQLLQHYEAEALHWLANALDGQERLDEALAIHLERLELLESFAENQDVRQSLAYSHSSIGLLYWRQSQRSKAIPHYQRYTQLLEELAKETPDESYLRIDLGQGLLNLGELLTISKDSRSALAAFRHCLKIRHALVQDGHQEPDRLTDLAWAEARLAQFGDNAVERWKKVERLLTRADAVTPLGDFEEELLTVARITLSGAQD